MQAAKNVMTINVVERCLLTRGDNIKNGAKHLCLGSQPRDGVINESEKIEEK